MNSYKYNFLDLNNLVKSQFGSDAKLTWKPSPPTLVPDPNYVCDLLAIRWRFSGPDLMLTIEPKQGSINKVELTTQETLDLIYDIAKEQGKHIRVFTSNGTELRAEAEDIRAPLELEFTIQETT